MVTQLEDRVDGVPGLGLHYGQGFQFPAAQRGRLFENHVGTDPPPATRPITAPADSTASSRQARANAGSSA